MKKVYVKTLVLFLFFLPRAPVFGQSGFSLGVGGEANIITLEDRGYALGGGLITDYRFGPVFAAGVRLDAFYDGSALLSFENRLFVRWYFARPSFLEFFFQGDAGVLIAFRGSMFENGESRGSPGGGLTLGLRIFLPDRWYLEPYIRGGFPFIFGGGIIAGYALPFKDRDSGGTGGFSERDLRSGEEPVIFRSISSVPEIAALAIEPYVYFGPNAADFTGLDAKTAEDNYRLLRELARFLSLNPEYDLVIEGHANPAAKARDGEQPVLNPLSLERAQAAADSLMYYGVDRKRLVVAGSGGTKALVPWSDRENWSLNRRVEFMLIRQTGSK